MVPYPLYAANFFKDIFPVTIPAHKSARTAGINHTKLSHPPKPDKNIPIPYKKHAAPNTTKNTANIFFTKFICFYKIKAVTLPKI